MSSEKELKLLKKLLAEKERQLNVIKPEEKKEKSFSYQASDEELEFNDLSDTENIEDTPKLFCKIGNKKNICVYGLHQRLPVSLKPFQWELLYQFMMSGELHKFIKENQKKLI